MKNEGITQGPFYAAQWLNGSWVVKVGPAEHDQQVAYLGVNNPHVETGSAKGNAQLFAAAPELLAFAKEVAAHCASPLADCIDVRKLGEMARAAIAKAESRA